MSIFTKPFKKPLKETKDKSQPESSNILSTSAGKYENEGIIEKGCVEPIDLICPSSIDTRNPDFILVDGTYIATLLVVTYI